MKKRVKIALSLLVVFCAVTILLVTAILITPWLIDHTVVGDKVRGEVSKLVGGEFDFKEVDLSFFPIPSVVVASPKINLSQKLLASAEETSV